MLLCVTNLAENKQIFAKSIFFDSLQTGMGQRRSGERPDINEKDGPQAIAPVRVL